MLWNEISSDPRWATLDEADRRHVADNFFKGEVVSDPRWEKLSPTGRNTVYDRFLKEAFPPEPPKPTIGEKLTLTGSEDNLGGVLGPPLRGLLQTPLQFGTGIARAIGGLSGDESIMEGADLVDKAIEYMLPQVSGKYAQAPEQLHGYLNPWRVFNVLMEQGPTFAALGLKGLENKTALTLFYSAVATGQASQAIRDYELNTGETVPEAYKKVMPIIVGGVSGILDVIGLQTVFGKEAGEVVKNRFARTLLQTVIEGSTEAMQEGVQILGEMGYTEHDAKQTFDRLALNAYGGLVLGGFGAAGMNYLGPQQMEGAVDKGKRTELDKPVEVTHEAVGKQIAAESELPPKPYNLPDILALDVDAQEKIALNKEFALALANPDAFSEAVNSDVGINGTLHFPTGEIDLNIKPYPDGGFLITSSKGGEVKENVIPNHEALSKYIAEVADGSEQQFMKAQQSAMRAPETFETQLRPIKTTLRFYDNLDKVKGNVNLEQLPLKNLSKEEQAFIRSVAQDLKDAGEKVVTKERLKEAVEASKLPIEVEVEPPTTQSIDELRAALQGLEQTPAVKKQLATLETRSVSPAVLGSDYTVPGYNPKTHNRWLFTTNIDFGEAAHPGIDATNAIGWAEVAESEKDSKTLMVFEVQPSDKIKNVDKGEAVGTTDINVVRQIKTLAPHVNSLMYRSIIQEAASRGYEKVLFPVGETVEEIEGTEAPVELYNKQAARIEKEYKGKTERVTGAPLIGVTELFGEDVVQKRPDSIDSIRNSIVLQLEKFGIDISNLSERNKVEIASLTKSIDTGVYYKEGITALKGNPEVTAVDVYYDKDTDVVVYTPSHLKKGTASTWLQVNLTPELAESAVPLLRPTSGQEPQVTSPQDDPNFQRVLDRVKQTGMAVDIEVLDHTLTATDAETGVEVTAQGQYIPRAAVGGAPEVAAIAGRIQLSTPTGLYTAAHELYHAWKDAVGRYNPLITQAEGEFWKEAKKEGLDPVENRNPEEAFAAIVGEYFTGRILNPSLETKLTDFLARLRTAATDNVSKETIAKTVVNSLLTRDPLQLTRYKVDPQYETRAAKMVRQGMEASQEAELLRRERTSEKLLDSLQRGLFDRQATFMRAIRRVGGDLAEKVIRLTRVRAGATSAGLLALKKNMTDVYGGLTAEQERHVDALVFLRSLEERRRLKPGYKLPRGMTLEGIQQEIDAMKQTDPEAFEFYNDRASKYFDVTSALLDIMAMNGIKSIKEYEKLAKNKQYFTADHLSKDNPVDPLMEAQLGGPSPLSLESRALLESYISRVFRLVASNEANVALYEFTKANPDYGPGRLAPGSTGGWTKIVGRVDGEEKITWLPDKLAHEFRGGDAVQNLANMKWLGSILFGTKIVKFFATGANPLFHVLYNPPMDWARIQLFTSTYSKSLPKGIMEMAQDLAATASDVWHKKGLYNTFVQYGANQEFLTNMGQFKTRAGTKLAALQDKLGRLGEFTEAWSRVAQMRREMKNGKSAAEAAYISRNSLDYSQGGAWAKVGDVAIPYLNAGLQGTRVATSYAWNNPGTFAIKFGQLAAGSIALAAANMMYDEYDEVSEYDKMNNFVIMSPLTYKEKDGSTGRYYFKIRKEQALRPLLYVTEQLLRLGMGKPVRPDAASRAAASAISALNVDPGNVPATLRSMLALTSNYDLWRGQEIWQGAKGKMKDEYDEGTPHIFRMLGAFTGLSPERLRVAGGSLVSPTNPFINLTGFGLEQLLRSLSPEEREKTTVELTQDISLVKGLVGTTWKRNRIMSNVADLREQEASKHLNQNREVDRLSGVYWQDPTKERKKAILDYIRTQPLLDRTRLIQRYTWQGKIKDIPDKDWWMSARGDSPQIRAIRFYDRYQKANAQGKKELNTIARKLPGFTTPTFIAYLRRLRSGLGSATEIE